MIEQLERLIQATQQMAADDPGLPQARDLLRERSLATLRRTYPNLDLTNCADVTAAVLKNLGNRVQWVDENGVPIANDEPVIRDALLSELRMVLCATTIARSGAQPMPR